MKPNEKPTKAFTLALIAGILIISNAVLLGAAATWFPGIIPELPGSNGNAGVPFLSLTAFGLICGAIVVFGAIMLRNKPENKKAWGTIMIVFSIPAVIMGGGFIIGSILGSILGIIGGARALSRKT